MFIPRVRKDLVSSADPAALFPLFRPKRCQAPVPIGLDLHIKKAKTLQMTPTMNNHLVEVLILIKALQKVPITGRLLIEMLLRIGVL